MNEVLAAILGLALLAGGAVVVLRAASIQFWILGRYKTWTGLAAWNPWLPWMKTPGYRRYLRFMGVVMVAMGLLLLVLVSG
jgi:hypothetical protein